MKVNTKGFTLVELLAVIVILGIVALVTTPAILNVINNARRSGAEDKAWGTIDAVKLAYVQSQSLDYADEVLDNQTIDFSTAGEKTIGNRKITVSGEMPSAGKVHVDVTNTGKITAVNLKFTKNGTYICTSNTEGTAMCCISGNNAPSDSNKSQCKGFTGTLATDEHPW